MSEAIRVSRGLVIPADEIEWRFSASGGPGGQHANTSNTRVEARFDVLASRALGPRQRARLLAKLGPVVRVVVSAQRSQLRNREIALRRLCERLEEALRVEKERRPTRPSRRVAERRLQEKRHRSDVKRMRRSPDNHG